jgi:predicted nucleotidyltransferase
MDKNILKSKIKIIINSNRDKIYKNIALTAVITEALKEINIRPIIVGGQAVEFYTAGGYSTMDVDLVTPASIKEINPIIEELGFEKEGKYWTYDQLDFALEVPGSDLAGDYDKVNEIEIEGLKAYIIGIEDIIIDRLNRYKFWKEYADQEWIVGMIYLNYEDIDWDYLYQKSESEKTLEELKEFKKIVDKKINK